MTSEKVDELVEKRRLQVIKDARKMSEEELAFVPQPPPKDKLTEVMLEKIPFLSGFLNSIDGTGTTISKLAALKGSGGAQAVATGFEIGSVLLAIFDLVRIPIMFLAARYLKVELPFTLTHAARLAYSILILGFALAAVLAPAAVLPIIGIASAAFGVVASAIIFGRLIFDLYKNSKAMKRAAKDITQITKELASLQDELRSLAEALAHSKSETEYAEIEEQIIRLREQYIVKKEQAQKLHDKQALLQKVWDEELGFGAGLDKSVAVGLAVGVLAGAVIALFFPPLGVAIVSCSVAVGTAYLIGRTALALGNKLDKALGLILAAGIIASAVLTLFFPPLGMGIFAACVVTGGAYLVGRVAIALITGNKGDKHTASIDSQQVDTPEQVVKESEIHESTGLVVGLMAGKEHLEDELRKLAAFQHWLGDVDNALHSHIVANNPAAVLGFFIKLAAYAKEKASTTVDVQCFISSLCETNKETLPFLERALNDVAISNQEKKALLGYVPMVEALQKNKITGQAVSALIQTLQQPSIDGAKPREEDAESEGASYL